MTESIPSAYDPCWENTVEPPWEFMPDPQFNHACPTCLESNDPVMEHSTGNWLWRSCCACGEAEGVRIG